MNRWAIFARPLSADLAEVLFVRSWNRHTLTGH
jgi:hypothetical protein